MYEDGQVQDVSHFSSDRVPVSLGIALDTSGSMTPEKVETARAAIERLISKLLDEDDELFFVEFATRVRLVQGWTTERRLIIDALRRVEPVGGTALYDAVAEALPTAEEGRNRKKALLVISDGNDTNSNIGVSALRQRIRESEVLVLRPRCRQVRGRRASFNNRKCSFRPPFHFHFPAGDAGAAFSANRRRGRLDGHDVLASQSR